MSRNPPIETDKSVREIFTAALACHDPAERRRLLDSECGATGSLRGQVESLLEESSRVGDFLEQPAVSETLVDGESPSRRTAPLTPGEHPGDCIGPYQLIDLLGEGGGGSVYRAEQSGPVQRTVALKILKLGMDTRSVIARFETERQSLAMMDHPNIARVLDAGATKEGRPYFVMDFVPGEPITDYCDAHTLTVDERVSIFIKVCRAVEHAHQKGIIHRDLKPSNVLVTRQDGDAVPKIIDFGVAKAIDPASPNSHTVTRSEVIIGTPAYMSPEQVEGEGIDIDTRSDVYSLGILLHELLTSYTPLDPSKVAHAGIDDLRRSFRDMIPTRPSSRLQWSRVEDRPRIAIDRASTLEKLIARLRGDLDWVVMKCLESDRTRRFGSASDLAGDLDHYLAGEPVTARPPSPAYRIRKFVGRHRAAVAAGSVLLVTLIAAAAVSTTQAIRATRAEGDMRKAHQQQLHLRAVADHDREDALRSAATARLHQYVADINVSHHALSDGHIAQAFQLLERYTSPSPTPGNSEDLRGFEWRFLEGRCLGHEHRSLPSQQSAIESLEYSPDGRRLAIGTRDRLLVWDLHADELLAEFPGGVSSVSFFPNGDRLAAASRDGVWIHDLDSSIPVRELRDQGGSIALSPDGGLLATTGRRGVTIWDTTDWDRWDHLPLSSAPLAFSPDGKSLATGSREGLILRSMAPDGKQVLLEASPETFRFPFPGGNTVAFTPDGDYFISAQNSEPTRNGYSLGVWEVRTGEQIASLPRGPGRDHHAGLISAASFDASGSLLATSSWDHSVHLWDFETGRVKQALHGHRGEVWSVALAPDGEHVASGSKNGEIKIWPTVQVPPKDSVEGKWKPLSYSNDSNYVAALNRDGSISIINLRSMEKIYSIDLSIPDSRFGRFAVSLSGDLNTLAEGLPDGMVKIRQLDADTETSFKAADRRINFVQLSPAADSLVTVGWRDDLAWWDLNDPTAPIVRIAASQALFSADGTTLATPTPDGHLIVWDTASRTERARVVHEAPAFGSSVALSPDGKLIAMSHGFEDFENAITLWDTAKGERLGTLSGHKQAIRSIAFSPDGKTLASSGGGGTLRLWNVASQRELLTIREPGTTLSNLQFSPDGLYLVGASPSFTTKAKLRIIHAPQIHAPYTGR